MDWRKGYTAEYYAEYVDPDTWRGIGRFEITSGKVVRKDSGLLQSADIGCTKVVGDDLWIRLWMNAKQDGDTAHVALFTGLSSYPSDNIDGYHMTYDAQLYSVLRPADKYLLPLGWFAPKGMKGTDLIKELLSVGPAPIVIEEDSPILSQNIIAEKNETGLTMTEKILEAIGWRMMIDGMGVIHILSPAKTHVAVYDPIDNDAIEPVIKRDRDSFDCPNVIRCIKGDDSAIARDDDPDSPLSTVRRGYEIWAQETDCKLNDNESLGGYAIRRLKELQAYSVNVSYDRRFNPDINVTDIVSMNYPRQNIVGLYRVTSQNITLGYGGKTSEEVIKI